MKKKYFFGLANTYHDPALAIIDSEGKTLFAEATERFTQYKHGVSIPADHRVWARKVIREYCEYDAEFHFSLTWSKKLVMLSRLALLSGLYSFKKIPKSRKIGKNFQTFADQCHNVVLSAGSLNTAGIGMLMELKDTFSNNKTVDCAYFPHHLTHAANSCYTSPFREALCFVVDGEGEAKHSMALYRYKNKKIEKVKQFKPKPNVSLGYFYRLITSLCRFSRWEAEGEQWKVMGLAPYGKLNEEIYAILKKIIHFKNGRLLAPGLSELRRNVAKLQKFVRKKKADPLESADMAFTGQFVFSELMTDLINSFYEMGISDNLVLGGGCALNSSYNGRILEKSKFKNLRVPCSPGDDGNALGAAALSFYKENPDGTLDAEIESPYLGSKISSNSLERLRKLGNIPKLRHLPNTLCEEAAGILAKGKLIGWIQGRAEFGPRALGNRSILADPRRREMKDKINSAVKFREGYRPFAPSILHEFGDEYFENYQVSRYMERTLVFKESAREKVPAVVHADKTGRLQTVKREWNPKYYDLIKSFHDITGIPLVLNTSFNIMGKPVIHSVEDAVGVFYTSGLDALVIGDYLIEK